MNNDRCALSYLYGGCHGPHILPTRLVDLRQFCRHLGLLDPHRQDRDPPRVIRRIKPPINLQSRQVTHQPQQGHSLKPEKGKGARGSIGQSESTH